MHAIPIRCTQNPTMGEEWRRGWHPEKIEKKGAAVSALVVGAGPAGLECAMQLARRGYEVTLADARESLGGRVHREGGLVGLGAWRRVADNRLHDLRQRAKVSIYAQSLLGAADVAELGLSHVFIATGATWRSDGVGRTSPVTICVDDTMPVLTPDDIMDGKLPPDGVVAIYDDDQAYMGGVLAAELASAGREVTLITPAPIVSPWTEMTLEQARIQIDLVARGVRIETGRKLTSVDGKACITHGVYGEAERAIPCDSVIMVTSRQRETGLYYDLAAMRAAGDIALETLQLIGDAAQPGLIADAVYSGHAAARAFEGGATAAEVGYFRREMIALHD